MMATTQLLPSIGIPSLLVVLSWITNSTRLGNIERRLDAHDGRFNDVISNNHKDALEIMRSMTALHERVAVVETKLNS